MFTGTPVVKQVSDGLVRITGVSLVDGASGTIGLFEKSAAPDIRLPAGFKAREYSRPENQDVSLQDCIEVTFLYLAPTSGGAIPIAVTKTGTKPTDFQITMDAVASSETNTGELEIYVRYH